MLIKLNLHCNLTIFIKYILFKEDKKNIPDQRPKLNFNTTGRNQNPYSIKKIEQKRANAPRHIFVKCQETKPFFCCCVSHTIGAMQSDLHQNS